MTDQAHAGLCEVIWNQPVDALTADLSKFLIAGVPPGGGGSVSQDTPEQWTIDPDGAWGPGPLTGEEWDAAADFVPGFAPQFGNVV